jgi:hypothetical protein
MIYTEPADEEFIYDEDVMDAENFMDHEMYTDIEDVKNCCMKQTVKNYSKMLINKPLTDIQAILICLYQFIIMLFAFNGIIQFHIAARILTWLFNGLLEEDIILIIALFINITIGIEIIGALQSLIIAFLCKCDYISLRY